MQRQTQDSEDRPTAQNRYRIHNDGLLLHHEENFLVYEDYSTVDREPSLTESFTCEYCNKPFIIEATVSYKAKEETPEKDFSTNYVSLLD